MYSEQVHTLWVSDHAEGDPAVIKLRGDNGPEPQFTLSVAETDESTPVTVTMSWQEAETLRDTLNALLVAAERANEEAA